MVKDKDLICSYEDSISIKVTPLPTVKILQVPPVCIGETLEIEAKIDSLVISKEWIINGIKLSNEHKITIKADYPPEIILKVINAELCSNSDTLIVPLIQVPKINIESASFCPGDSVLLKPVVTGKNKLFKYYWRYNSQLLDFDGSSIYANQKGLYEVAYGKENCMTFDTSIVGIYPLPDVRSNEETVILCEETGSLNIDGGVASSYSWLPEGTTSRYKNIDTVGSYLVKIGNEFNCYSLDSVVVENRCAPKVYVPNAFSPTEEGENQHHRIFTYNVGFFELTILNRWGEIIYKTNDYKKPWDGYYLGELMPSGSYSWLIKYAGNNPDHKEIQQLEGKVVLVR